MVYFDVNCILPPFQSSAILFNPPHEIVDATHFNDTRRNPYEYHDKVLIGRLSSIAYPNNGQYIGKTPYYQGKSNANNQANKKGRYALVHTNTTIMLFFADLAGLPGTFAIILPRKLDFQKLFGDDSSRSELVRIGDVFAIKDPLPSRETLGESIIILKEPKIVVGVIASGWPRQELITSTTGNWQVCFDDTGKTIRVLGSCLIYNASDRTNCSGFMCDRQAYCKGCFGRSPTKRPIVLQCDVIVDDCPLYNNVGGVAWFPRVTTYRFTSLFFKDLETLSGKHVSSIQSLYPTIATAIPNMVTYINQHRGWEVAGWHRQGVINESATGDMHLSSETRGHITYLYPTDPTVLQDQAFRDMKIVTPNDERIPQLPVPPAAHPAQGVPPVPPPHIPPAPVPPARIPPVDHAAPVGTGIPPPHTTQTTTAAVPGVASPPDASVATHSLATDTVRLSVPATDGLTTTNTLPYPSQVDEENDSSISHSNPDSHRRTQPSTPIRNLNNPQNQNVAAVSPLPATARNPSTSTPTNKPTNTKVNPYTRSTRGSANKKT